MSKKKYNMGDKIETLYDLIGEYESDRGVYCLVEKDGGVYKQYYAPGWYANIRLSGLKTMVERNQFRYAIPLSSSRETG